MFKEIIKIVSNLNYKKLIFNIWGFILDKKDATKSILKYVVSTNKIYSNIKNYQFTSTVRKAHLGFFKTSELLRGQQFTSNKLFELQLSPWPIVFSIYILNLALVIVGLLNGVIYSDCYVELSFLFFILTLFMWLVDLSREGLLGFQTSSIQKCARIGFSLFIVSEIMFFFSLFWVFINSAVYSSIWIGGSWPLFSIINYLDTCGFWLPLANTILLLFSGHSLNISHDLYVKSAQFNANSINPVFFKKEFGMVVFFKEQCIKLLSHTIAIGFLFICVQYYEFTNSLYSYNDTVFGSIFFILTGFHGLHVIFGLVALCFSMIRIVNNSSRSDQHLWFEATAWYWHFVDVVWIFVCILIYIWGNSAIDTFFVNQLHSEVFFLGEDSIFIYDPKKIIIRFFFILTLIFWFTLSLIFDFYTFEKLSTYLITTFYSPAKKFRAKFFTKIFRFYLRKRILVRLYLRKKILFLLPGFSCYFYSLPLKANIEYITKANNLYFDTITLSGFVAKYFYLQTYILIFMINIFVFCFLMYFVFTHRKIYRSNKYQVRNPHVTHNTFLESTWTLIPASIVAILAGCSLPILALVESKNDWHIFNKSESDSPSIVRTRVIGNQWFWTYDYDLPQFSITREDVTTAVEQLLVSFRWQSELRLLSTYNNLVLPSITKLKFFITSTDVLHSFTIPSMFIKADACPGRLVTVGAVALKQGVFYGQCSEICGAGHSFMPSSLEIVEPNFFWATFIYCSLISVNTESLFSFNSEVILNFFETTSSVSTEEVVNKPSVSTEEVVNKPSVSTEEVVIDIN